VKLYIIKYRQEKYFACFISLTSIYSLVIIFGMGRSTYFKLLKNENHANLSAWTAGLYAVEMVEVQQKANNKVAQ